MINLSDAVIIAVTASVCTALPQVITALSQYRLTIRNHAASNEKLNIIERQTNGMVDKIAKVSEETGILKGKEIQRQNQAEFQNQGEQK